MSVGAVPPKESQATILRHRQHDSKYDRFPQVLAFHFLEKKNDPTCTPYRRLSHNKTRVNYSRTSKTRKKESANMDNLKGGNDNYNNVRTSHSQIPNNSNNIHQLPTQPPPIYPQAEYQVPPTYQAQPAPYPPAYYGRRGYYRNRYNNRRCIYICAALIVFKIVAILIVLAVVLHWGRGCYIDSDGNSVGNC
jgi:hypothetical protein